MGISMYSIIIDVISILPENQFDIILNFCTSIKYKNYLKKIKEEMISGDNNYAKEFAKSIDTSHQFDLYKESWMKKYRNEYIEVNHEIVGSKKYNCVTYNSRGGVGKTYKMYLPGEWKDTRVRNYMRSILIEQDENSYHQYFINGLYDKLPNEATVIDIGAAEGEFGLDMLDKAKKLFLFECDSAYVKTLRLTYKESIENGITTIAQKFVGDTTNANSCRLDDYFGVGEIPTDISIIKMDIEGAEISALKGMKLILEENPQAILLICAYHAQDAEERIRELLPDYDVYTKNQYGIVPSMGEQCYPYIRHGVLVATRKSI